MPAARLGFALTVVAGGALTASLIPAERRGEGLALAGIVSGVPSRWACRWVCGWSRTWGSPRCACRGVAALAAVVVVPGLPGRERSTGRDAGVVAGLRNGALARPTAVFATTAIGAGIIVTFLPVAVPASLSGLVAVALFAQPAMATVARWFAGRYGDRHGPARLVLPGLLASSAGLLVTSVTSSPVAVLAGVALFGAGFGVAQNATLTLMYAGVPASGYGTVSALWNVAYDGGMGLGAVGFGAAAAHTGYPAAFALTAGVMLVALVPAWRDR